MRIVESAFISAAWLMQHATVAALYLRSVTMVGKKTGKTFRACDNPVVDAEPPLRRGEPLRGIGSGEIGRDAEQGGAKL